MTFRIAVVQPICHRPGSDEANLIVNELLPLTELSARYTHSLRISVDERTHGKRGLEQL